MKTLNSKERILRTIKHKEPDRVPLSYSSFPGAWPEVQDRLRNYLKVENNERLLEVLGIDDRILRPRYIGPELKKYPGGTEEDMWGVRATREAMGTYSASCYRPPLKDVSSVKEIEHYPWPNPDWFDYSQIAEDCEKYEEYAIVSGGWCPISDDICHLMGMEAFMINMIEKPEIIHTLLDKITDFYYEFSRRIFEVGRGKIDIFFMGDDYGMQDGLLFSRKMWRKFLSPRLRRLYSLAKKYNLEVMMHSCGSVKEIIPDLIQLGVDILDPIQVRAKDMNPYKLKEEFGDRLCLHGSIDTQRTLPLGSPQEVAEEVKERIKFLAPGGGFILGPSQDFLPDIPTENIVVMYETARQYRRYPIRI